MDLPPHLASKWTPTAPAPLVRDFWLWNFGCPFPNTKKHPWVWRREEYFELELKWASVVNPARAFSLVKRLHAPLERFHPTGASISEARGLRLKAVLRHTIQVSGDFWVGRSALSRPLHSLCWVRGDIASSGLRQKVLATRPRHPEWALEPGTIPVG